MAPLFGDERCTAAILGFLEMAGVGMRRRCRREDSEDPGKGFQDELRGCGRIERGRGRIGERGQGGDGQGMETVPMQGRGVEPGSRCNRFSL
jgi:hypothetical protein